MDLVNDKKNEVISMGLKQANGAFLGAKSENEIEICVCMNVRCRKNRKT